MDDRIKSPELLWQKLKEMAQHDPLVAAQLRYAQMANLSLEHTALMLAVAALEIKSELTKQLIDTREKSGTLCKPST